MPTSINGVKCVIVNRDLRDAEPMAWDFCVNFAKDNDLNSRTYQQSSEATPANRTDRSNYAYFYYRRLPAEVLLDALNQATGTAKTWT